MRTQLLHFFAEDKENINSTSSTFQNALTSLPNKFDNRSNSPILKVHPQSRNQLHTIQQNQIQKYSSTHKNFVRYPQEADTSESKCIKRVNQSMKVTDLKMLKDFLLQSPQKVMVEEEEIDVKCQTVDEKIGDNFPKKRCPEEVIRQLYSTEGVKDSLNLNQREGLRDLSTLTDFESKQNQQKSNIKKIRVHSINAVAKQNNRPIHFLRQIKTLICPSEKESKIRKNSYQQKYSLPAVAKSYDALSSQQQSELCQNLIISPQNQAVQNHQKNKMRLEVIKQTDSQEIQNSNELNDTPQQIRLPLNHSEAQYSSIPKSVKEEDFHLERKSTNSALIQLLQQQSQSSCTDKLVKHNDNSNGVPFVDSHLTCSRIRKSNLLQKTFQPSSCKIQLDFPAEDSFQCDLVFPKKSKDSIGVPQKHIENNNNHCSNSSSSSDQNQDCIKQSSSQYQRNYNQTLSGINSSQIQQNELIMQNSKRLKWEHQMKLKKSTLNNSFQYSKEQIMQEIFKVFETLPLQEQDNNQLKGDNRNIINKFPKINSGEHKMRSRSFHCAKSPLMM